MPVRLDENFGMPPLKPIVPAKIKEMTDRYRAGSGDDDTKSCWVKVSEVQQLIADNPGANGIRLYYGRHADNDGADFNKRHNIILVTTRDTTTPDNPTSENSVDLLNPDVAIGPVNSITVTFAGMGGDVIPLCPPHCPTLGSSILT
jgi:hypothetical protein